MCLGCVEKWLFMTSLITEVNCGARDFEDCMGWLDELCTSFTKLVIAASFLEEVN